MDYSPAGRSFGESGGDDFKQNSDRRKEQMAGYWIVRSSAIENQAAFDEYAARWSPIAQKYGARLLTGSGGAHETREGDDLARVLLLEFPSYEQARAAYDDPEYQAALPFARDAYARRELIIVESG